MVLFDAKLSIKERTGVFIILSGWLYMMPQAIRKLYDAQSMMELLLSSFTILMWIVYALFFLLIVVGYVRKPKLEPDHSQNAS